MVQPHTNSKNQIWPSREAIKSLGRHGSYNGIGHQRVSKLIYWMHRYLYRLWLVACHHHLLLLHSGVVVEDQIKTRMSTEGFKERDGPISIQINQERTSPVPRPDDRENYANRQDAKSRGYQSKKQRKQKKKRKNKNHKNHSMTKKRKIDMWDRNIFNWSANDVQGM